MILIRLHVYTFILYWLLATNNSYNFVLIKYLLLLQGLRAAFNTFAKITKNGVTDQEVARGKYDTF